jgi:hypothetical protein
MVGRASAALPDALKIAVSSARSSIGSKYGAGMFVFVSIEAMSDLCGWQASGTLC